jgi:hypothetical protein
LAIVSKDADFAPAVSSAGAAAEGDLVAARQRPDPGCCSPASCPGGRRPNISCRFRVVAS